MWSNDGLADIFKVRYSQRFRGLELSWYMAGDPVQENVKLIMSVPGRYTGKVHTVVVTIELDDLLMCQETTTPVLDKVDAGTATLISRALEIQLQPLSRLLPEDAYNLV
jgi:hypothetical protein